MQAGWHGKDYVTTVTCFRWRYKALKYYLHSKLKDMQLHTLGVPVELMLPFFTDKIGSLKKLAPEPVVDESLWKDFEQEVAEVAQEKREKTSALLYGSPGNGKTSCIKYLATKYRLPIMVLTFNPEWSNHDLLLLFSQIPKKCIVLLEDFDNYFDKRRCIIGNENIKFTFDIILNGLDGVYTTYENVVFIMTVNDIEKVDPALRNRPSRFKFTRHFSNPPLQVRMKLIPPEWAELTDGLNLDQIFRLKESHAQGITLQDAVRMLEKELAEDELKKKAFARFEERVKNNIEGDHQSDWHYALKGKK
jgi:SpoVK/Ycf46/Vps4 family AAA+-type ATPase